MAQFTSIHSGQTIDDSIAQVQQALVANPDLGAAVSQIDTNKQDISSLKTLQKPPVSFSVSIPSAGLNLQFVFLPNGLIVPKQTMPRGSTTGSVSAGITIATFPYPPIVPPEGFIKWPCPDFGSNAWRFSLRVYPNGNIQFSNNYTGATGFDCLLWPFYTDSPFPG